MSAAGLAGGSAASYLETCANTGTRSAVVAWLTANYKKLLAATARRTLSWAVLARRLEQDGVRTRFGETVTAHGLRVQWYRVKRRFAAAEEKAEKERAAREAVKERQGEEEAGDAALRLRMEQADRAERYATSMRAEVRDAHVKAAAQRQERANQQAATAPEREIEPSDPSEFITLDLPVVKGVSDRAYLPVDPKLPPVRKGEVNRITGIAWRYGDDLPGYPSKRNYEYEREWLRDVGLLLRHRHPTNLTMTPEEKFVMRSAKSRIPNLY